MTGDGERYLSAELNDGRVAESVVDSDAGWWPPVKIPGRFLGPYLAGIDADARTRADAPSP